MSGVQLDEETMALASQKITELQSLITTASEMYSVTGAPLKPPKAVLVMYRQGTVNFRQDASDTIWSQISLLVLQRGFVPIRVAVGLSREQLRGDDFDLFDTRRQTAFVKKQYVARFWSLVATLNTVFGVIGPRTGSLDAAAFQGVRSFSWDEPMLQIIAGPDFLHLRQIYPDEYVREQLWQQVLLLGMRGIHSVGTLDPRSWDAETRQFKYLKEDQVIEWLWEKAVTLLIPATRESVRGFPFPPPGLEQSNVG